MKSIACIFNNPKLLPTFHPTMKPVEALKKYWGYDSFRSLQEEIILSAMDGVDSLALMPTGGGKSLCFQVPSMCQEGICLVVSPLIALMKDQVYHLREKKIQAEAIYSGMHYKDIDRVLDNCIYGSVKFLYLSPERLSSEIVQERISKMNVNLLAIDEAHCISQWGYDFRPAYLEIALIRPLLPDTPILALTATATKKVVDDIQQKLEFKNGKVFQKSFGRDNLAYVVLNEEGKEAKLLDILRKVKGSGVVYVRNRKKTKAISVYLNKNGIIADFYHAGLSTDERSKKQEDWINNKIRIIVCTNAFGMGIDKPDVRTVVHLDLPDSPEAYFQEAGRAGRDGKKAFAILLYSIADGQNLERNLELSFPPIPEIKRTYQALGSYFQLATGAGKNESYDFDLVSFCQKFSLQAITVFSSLKILEQSGWIAMTESVYVPSSLKIYLNKDQLYDYQLKNKNLDNIIKTILRSYQGAFHNYVSINETQLAKFLKMDKQEFINALIKLRTDRVILYRPKKDAPQIIFLEDRVDISNLMIDQKLYDFRKNRQMERVKKMLAYAEDTVCRHKQLLSYFGEKEVAACGICDVCLGRNEVAVSKDDFARYKEKIQKLLGSKSLRLKELVGSFAPKREKTVLKVIEILVDEGMLEMDAEEISWAG